MDETHALCLTFLAWSRSVAVPLAHLVSGAPAVYGCAWLDRPQGTIIMSSASTQAILCRQ